MNWIVNRNHAFSASSSVPLVVLTFSYERTKKDSHSSPLLSKGKNLSRIILLSNNPHNLDVITTDPIENRMHPANTPAITFTDMINRRIAQRFFSKSIKMTHQRIVVIISLLDAELLQAKKPNQLKIPVCCRR